MGNNCILLQRILYYIARAVGSKNIAICTLQLDSCLSDSNPIERVNCMLFVSGPKRSTGHSGA